MRIDEVIAPSILGDALASLKRFPDSVLYAGGTAFFQGDLESPAHSPATVLSLHSISELKSINRTDRYIEVGAMTPLSDLLALKEGFIPGALRDTIRNIGNFAVRNLATLGGNLSCRDRFRDCFPVLACMEALAEFRQASSSRWVNLNRLVDDHGLPAIPKGEILTRVRIPLMEWNIGVVQKFDASRAYSERRALFVFLARLDKRAISDFKIFYTHDNALRDRAAETALMGKKIPLSSRDIDATLGAYESLCARTELDRIQSVRFLSLVRKALSLLNEGTGS